MSCIVYICLGGQTAHSFPTPLHGATFELVWQHQGRSPTAAGIDAAASAALCTGHTSSMHTIVCIPARRVYDLLRRNHRGGLWGSCCTAACTRVFRLATVFALSPRLVSRCTPAFTLPLLQEFNMGIGTSLFQCLSAFAFSRLGAK